MRHLWGLIVIVILVWYIGYYYRYPSETTILQTILPNFHFDLLLEKQPIVLQDQITDLSTLKNAWFPRMCHLHTWTSDTSWQLNKHKYLVLQPQVDTLLYLYPRGKPMLPNGVPDPAQSILLEIHLKAHQVVILPYKYYYHTEEPGVPLHAIACHDIFTWILP